MSETLNLPQEIEVRPLGKKVRNSNIEILRIVSMFMILGLHVNVYSIGSPSAAECVSSPIPSFTRCALEMICIIAVNLFVLISGWFSIKFSLKGLAKFVFQCVFILSLMYAIGLSIGKASLTPGGLLQCFFLLNNAWFVTAYIGLFLLSPFLNSFCEKATEKQLRIILILFYGFQTLYGNLINAVPFIANGYSTFSFIGLYLLARYLRLHGEKLIKYSMLLYLGSTLGLILWYYFSCRFGIGPLKEMAFIYTNPLNVISAASLLLWTATRQPRYSKTVNWIAASVFSVYLCHICNSWTAGLYKEISRQIFTNNESFKYLGLIFVFMLSVFVFAILIDQLRKLIWQTFTSVVGNRFNRLRLTFSSN